MIDWTTQTVMCDECSANFSLATIGVWGMATVKESAYHYLSNSPNRPRILTGVSRYALCARCTNRAMSGLSDFVVTQLFGKEDVHRDPDIFLTRIVARDLTEGEEPEEGKQTYKVWLFGDEDSPEEESLTYDLQF